MLWAGLMMLEGSCRHTIRTYTISRILVPIPRTLLDTEKVGMSTLKIEGEY